MADKREAIEDLPRDFKNKEQLRSYHLVEN